MKISNLKTLVSILFDNDKVEVFKRLFGDIDDTERAFNAKLLDMYKNDEITQSALLEYLEVTQGDVVEALQDYE